MGRVRFKSDEVDIRFSRAQLRAMGGQIDRDGYISFPEKVFGAYRAVMDCLSTKEKAETTTTRYYGSTARTINEADAGLVDTYQRNLYRDSVGRHLDTRFERADVENPRTSKFSKREVLIFAALGVGVLCYFNSSEFSKILGLADHGTAAYQTAKDITHHARDVSGQSRNQVITDVVVGILEAGVVTMASLMGYKIVARGKLW